MINVPSEKKSKASRYGEGSIYQRNDGYWVVKYSPRAGVKPIVKYAKTEPEANRKLRELKKSPEALLQTNPTQVSVEEYFTNWFNTYKKPKVKQATYDRLEVVLRNQIFPVIGTLLLGNVSSDDCQNLINDLIESGSSFTVVKKTYDLLSNCFLHATIKGDLPRNPMLIVQGPLASNFDKKEVRALTEEEEKALLEELGKKWTTGAPKYCYRDAFILMLNTGIREGEMVALDWNDIDFDQKVMCVNKTAILVKERDREGKLTGKNHQEIQLTPKTKSGNRYVPLNTTAIDALKRMQKESSAYESVLISKNGRRPVVTVLQKQLKRAADRCKIYGVSPHVLRHTFATRLFERKADVKSVSELLGHSSVNITYNTYIHVIREKKQDVVGLLEG